jgi:hypothetical protein
VSFYANRFCETVAGRLFSDGRRPLGEKFFDSDFIPQETDVFLRQDGNDELVVVFETRFEIFLAHYGVFDLPTEKRPFEKIIEFDAVELTQNEYVDNPVRRTGEKVFEAFGNGYERNVLPPLEELLYRTDRIVGFKEYFGNFVKDRTMFVQIVEFFLVLFPRPQDSKVFEVHQFTTDGIDLFVQIATKFPDEKSGFGVPGDVFDDEFFKNLRARLRTEEFGEVHWRAGVVFRKGRTKKPQYALKYTPFGPRINF